MSGTELQIGAQARAAALVTGALPDVESTLRDLGAAVADASEGFRGGAAGALAEALSAWYDAAGDLIPTLSAYAAKLTAVDETAAETEQRQHAAYSRIAGRLGGPS